MLLRGIVALMLLWPGCGAARAEVPAEVDPIDFRIVSDLFGWNFNPELRNRRRHQLDVGTRQDFSGRLVLTWSFPGAHPEDSLRPFSERASQIALAHQALVDADGTYPNGVAGRYRRAMSRANRKLKKRLRRSGELDDAAGRFPTRARAVEELLPLLVRRMGRRSPVAILLGVVEPRDVDIPYAPPARIDADPESSFVQRIWSGEPSRAYLPFACESGVLLLCGNEAFKIAHLSLMERDLHGEHSYREIFEGAARGFLEDVRPEKTRDPLRNHAYTEALHDRLDAAGIGDRLKRQVLAPGAAAERLDQEGRDDTVPLPLVSTGEGKR